MTDECVWHDEMERWQQTGRLDQGPCWCAECLAAVLNTDPREATQ